MEPSTKFTPLQQEPNADRCNENDNKLSQVTDVDVKELWDRLQKKVDAAVERMGYTQEDFDAWLNDPNQ